MAAGRACTWRLAAPGPKVVTRFDDCHKGRVGGCQFRPSMKHLVTGGWDGQVLLWSLHPRAGGLGACARPYRFLGHDAAVCCLAVSPLDNLIVSGSKDRSVRFWRPSVLGRSRAVKPAHSGAVRAVAFAPSGQHVLSAGDDKMVKVWWVPAAVPAAGAGPRFLLTLAGHLNWVRAAEFSPDGSLIASGGDDKTVRVWNFDRRECTYVFRDLLAPVACVRFSVDGTCVVSGGADCAVQLRDLRSHMLVQHYADTGGPVHALAFHPSGHFLLSAAGDAVRVWDVRQGRPLYTLKGHGDGNVTAAAFSRDGDHFTTGSSQQVVLIWRSNLGQSCTGRRYNCALEEQVECRSRRHILRPSRRAAATLRDFDGSDIIVPSEDDPAAMPCCMDFDIGSGDRVKVDDGNVLLDVIDGADHSSSASELEAAADDYLACAVNQLDTLRHSVANLERHLASATATAAAVATAAEAADTIDPAYQSQQQQPTVVVGDCHQNDVTILLLRR